MKKIIFLLIILFSSFIVSAQVLNTYNLYVKQPFIINPASIGNGQSFEAFINSHRSLIEFDDAPKTLFFGFSGPINEKMGIGTKIITDKRGIIETSSWCVSYSYRVFLDDQDQNLTFGISGGALRKTLNKNRAIVNEVNDPVLTDNNFDQLNFEGDVGIWYNRKKFQFGVSAPHIYQFYNHYLFYGSYTADMKDFKICPSVLVQSLPGADIQYDFSLFGQYKENFWISGSYRSNNNLLFGCGFKFDKVGVGYSFEINNSKLSNIAKNSHEIMISYTLGKKKTLSEIVKENKQEPVVTIPVVQEPVVAKTNDNDFKRRIDMLEETILLQQKLNNTEKELQDLKAAKQQLAISNLDSILNTNTSEISEIEFIFDNSKDNDKSYTMKTSPAQQGYFTIIATVDNPLSASSIVKKMTKKGKTVLTLFNTNNNFYYIYTQFSTNLTESQKLKDKEIINGFKDAWILQIK
jgi:type IX secretion system PorP/SprF family membrane protein